MDISIRNATSSSSVQNTRRPPKPNPEVMNAAAKTLGLSAEELRNQLRQGKSLAEIAESQNVSVDDLKAAMLESVSGDERTNLEQRIDDMIEATPSSQPPPPPNEGTMKILQATADYLGISGDELMQELDSGKSLADIAKDNGKTVEDLKKALTSALSTESTQEDSFSDMLDKILQQRVSKSQRDQPPPPPPSSASTSYGGYGVNDVIEISSAYTATSKVQSID